MKFVTRAEWGAQYAQGSSKIPGPVYGVTLHWEGPRMGTFGHDACAGKVRGIERFHAETRKWAGIAYTLVVCPHGYVFEGRGAGIRSAANGESAIGGNDHWYAVCYLSGQGDPLTDAGKDGLTDAVRYLREHGAGAKVNGHRDHHATECPGDDIYGWLQRARFNLPAPAPRKAKSRGRNIDHAVTDLEKAAKANRSKPVRFRRIKAALAHLTRINKH